MYVTRPLSMYKRDPSALSLPPPEGPNSGILVILDEEAEPTCCFGLCKSDVLPELPFPQNKNLKTYYTTTINSGVSSTTHYHYNKVVFIPVLNQPLSSNRYYAIQPRGRHQGEAFTNSNDEDMTTCCFCQVVNDRKPEPFDPSNVYQQIEICSRHRGSFYAKSVEPDGFPPTFLRRKGWKLEIKTPHNFYLGEAPGLNTALRDRLPDFNNLTLASVISKPVVVGKWYSPFIFIKESSLTLKQQMSISMYYEITLEQRWEQIFSCENGSNEENVVIDVAVEREMVSLAGMNEGVLDVNINVVDGFMWFKSINNVGGEMSLGLSTAITERMKWEEERFGWNIEGNERQVRVKRVEEFGRVGEWRKIGFYVLVERFILKRMDGSLVLTYDFKHTHQVRTKWE